MRTEKKPMLIEYKHKKGEKLPVCVFFAAMRLFNSNLEPADDELDSCESLLWTIFRNMYLLLLQQPPHQR